MRLVNIMSNNFHKLYIKGVVLYFSYETLIGLVSGNMTLVTKNEWGRTTGKHINYIKRNHSDYLEINHNDLLQYASELF